MEKIHIVPKPFRNLRAELPKKVAPGMSFGVLLIIAFLIGVIVALII